MRNQSLRGKSDKKVGGQPVHEGSTLEMIDFAIVDGKLDDKEYDFLQLIAEELKIEKDVFMSLFEKRAERTVIKGAFNRVVHFYRLALLMHCDGIIHTEEVNKINEIGIKMGLDPDGIKRVLKLMEESENAMIAPEKVILAFQNQLN